MEQKGELVSFRPDIKVVDCTLRDGGLVNNFEFSEDFVRDLYKANVAAGVDYMEFGYKASKEVFKVEDYGKWKFCDEKDIRAIVGDNDTDLKISVMADVGRTDYKKDIIPKSESVIDMVRVATYINTIPAAIEMINYCADMGYEVTINIMAISTASENELDLALELLAAQSKASVIYLVDSYGSLYPEQIRRLADKYIRIAEKYGIYVLHNNSQTFQSHTGINVFIFQFCIVAFPVIFKLSKYIIPNLDIAVTLTANRTTGLSTAVFFSTVVINLRTRTARTGTMFPEIIFFSKTENAVFCHPNFLIPDIKCFIIF